VGGNERKNVTRTGRLLSAPGQFQIFTDHGVRLIASSVDSYHSASLLISEMSWRAVFIVVAESCACRLSRANQDELGDIPPSVGDLRKNDR
jgi:hypothetical protein